MLTQKFKLLTCFLALFFVVLAVYDGFEQDQEIKYCGEFLDEADFDYVDFPTSISRSTNSNSTKIQRLIVFSVFDFVSEVFSLNKPDFIKAEYIPLNIFLGIDFLIGKSIAANAP